MVPGAGKQAAAGAGRDLTEQPHSTQTETRPTGEAAAPSHRVIEKLVELGGQARPRPRPEPEALALTTVTTPVPRPFHGGAGEHRNISPEASGGTGLRDGLRTGSPPPCDGGAHRGETLLFARQLNFGKRGLPCALACDANLCHRAANPFLRQNQMQKPSLGNGSR